MVYPYSGNLHGEIQGMNHQFLPDTALRITMTFDALIKMLDDYSKTYIKDT